MAASNSDKVWGGCEIDDDTSRSPICGEFRSRCQTHLAECQGELQTSSDLLFSAPSRLRVSNLNSSRVLPPTFWTHVLRKPWRTLRAGGGTISTKEVGWDKPLWAQAHHLSPGRAKRGGPAVQSDLVPPYEPQAADGLRDSWLPGKLGAGTRRRRLSFTPGRAALQRAPWLKTWPALHFGPPTPPLVRLHVQPLSHT